MIFQAKQQLDQLSCSNHLNDQIETNHGQRADGSHRTNATLIQTIGGDICKSELAKVSESLCHEEQDDRPADKKGNHEQIGIVPIGVHHGSQTEQGCGGHVVPCHGQTILKSGNTATRRVEIGCRFGATGGPIGDTKRQCNKNRKHHNGWNVERLLLSHFDRWSCQCRTGACQREQASNW